MAEIVIDGSNLILGRLASYVAKRILEGDKVYIVNAENVVVTGNWRWLVEEFRRRIERGDPYKGPFYPRRPDRIVKRAIRGMVPRKKWKGRMALKRVKVYIGFPEEIKKKNLPILTAKDLPDLSVEKLEVPKFAYLKEICKVIGGWKGE